MLALDLLRMTLTGAMDSGRKVPPVGAPVSGIVEREAKGLQHRLQLQKHLILPPPKDVGQDLPGLVTKGMPEPPWLRLLAHKTPPFVSFGFVYPFADDCAVARGQAREHGVVHR